MRPLFVAVDAATGNDQTVFVSRRLGTTIIVTDMDLLAQIRREVDEITGTVTLQRGDDGVYRDTASCGEQASRR